MLNRLKTAWNLAERVEALEATEAKRAREHAEMLVDCESIYDKLTKVAARLTTRAKRERDREADHPGTAEDAAPVVPVGISNDPATNVAGSSDHNSIAKAQLRAVARARGLR